MMSPGSRSSSSSSARVSCSRSWPFRSSINQPIRDGYGGATRRAKRKATQPSKQRGHALAVMSRPNLVQSDQASRWPSRRHRGSPIPFPSAPGRDTPSRFIGETTLPNSAVLSRPASPLVIPLVVIPSPIARGHLGGGHLDRTDLGRPGHIPQGAAERAEAEEVLIGGL